MAAVDISDRDRIRWIVFDRPAKLNVLTAAELVAVTGALADLKGVSAVVFTGAGARAFSAGMHIGAFADLDPPRARRLIGLVRDFVAAARTAPVPTVCAINGYCLGAAFELALACDLRVSADHAGFGLPEIKVGVPSVVDSSLLQQHVGLSKAKEMILTGDIYRAAEMDSYGLLNAVVPAERLLDETGRWLDRITGYVPSVVAAQKRLFETWQNTTLADGIEASLDSFAEVFADPETQAHIASQQARLAR